MEYRKAKITQKNANNYALNVNKKIQKTKKLQNSQRKIFQCWNNLKGAIKKRC